MAVQLGVDFIVQGRRKGWEAVGAVLAYDVSFHGPGARVGYIDNGVRQRIVLGIEDLAKQQPAVGLVFLIGRCAGNRGEGQ